MTEQPNPEQPPAFHPPYPHQQGNSWMPQDGVPPAYLQQHYQPAWQLPPSPQGNKKTLVIIFGSIIGLLFLALIIGFTVFNSMAVKESAKIAHMREISERIVPGSDWTLTGTMEPKVDPLCIPSNLPCHRLQKFWQMPNPVDAAEIESQLKVDFTGKMSSFGCPIAEEGNIKIELCVPNTAEPQVSLYIHD